MIKITIKDAIINGYYQQKFAEHRLDEVPTRTAYELAMCSTIGRFGFSVVDQDQENNRSYESGAVEGKAVVLVAMRKQLEVIEREYCIKIMEGK